jgi:nucleolar GTP-binding protein
MNFQKIPPVELSDVFLDIAFRRAREKVASKSKYPKDALQKARVIEHLRLDVVKDNIIFRLERILNTFPGTITLPPFYQKIIKLTLDYKRLKESFGAVNWAHERIRKVHGQYTSKVRKIKDVKTVKVLHKQFYGRVASLLKQIDKNLSYLEEARRTMKTYPDIKELYTVCLYGFPNVGKSTLLNTMTGTKAKTAAYSFTTVTINAGYIHMGDKTVQVLDVPGTLGRDKHNDIEKQAELVLEEVADLIIYVYDITENCGYSIEKQKELRKKLGKDVIVYLSKKDLLEQDTIDSFDEKHHTLDQIKELIDKESEERHQGLLKRLALEKSRLEAEEKAELDAAAAKELESSQES